jgi:hypothetical protein
MNEEQHFHQSKTNARLCATPPQLLGFAPSALYPTYTLLRRQRRPVL